MFRIRSGGEPWLLCALSSSPTVIVLVYRQEFNSLTTINVHNEERTIEQTKAQKGETVK